MWQVDIGWSFQCKIHSRNTQFSKQVKLICVVSCDLVDDQVVTESPSPRWVEARGEPWLACEWVTGLTRLLTPSLCRPGPGDGVGGARVSLGPTFPRPNVPMCISGHFKHHQHLSAICMHLEYFQLRFDALDTMWRMIRKPYFPADDNISSGWASFNSVPVPGAGEVSRRHTQTERLGLPGGRHSESE